MKKWKQRRKLKLLYKSAKSENWYCIFLLRKWDWTTNDQHLQASSSQKWATLFSIGFWKIHTQSNPAPKNAGNNEWWIAVFLYFPIEFFSEKKSVYLFLHKKIFLLQKICDRRKIRTFIVGAEIQYSIRWTMQPFL